jgi:hypothetical protein
MKARKTDLRVDPVLIPPGQLTLEDVERFVELARAKAGIEAQLKTALEQGDERKALALARQLFHLDEAA